MLIDMIHKSFPKRMPPCDNCDNRAENLPSSKSTVAANKDLGNVLKISDAETGFVE